ncbi:hypothetical protein B0J14DRAFT_679062 [Halenospora varia]|nr:hypothetical protein B0J14DRAFT_679062 [Halenospora varia]
MSVNETFPAAIPQLSEELESVEAVDEALKVVVKATQSLLTDLSVFHDKGPFRTIELISKFLGAASFRRNLILEKSYEILEAKSSLPRIKELGAIALAKTADCLQWALSKHDISAVKEGDQIPTATPRELLYNILLHEEESIAQLNADGHEETLRNISTFLYKNLDDQEEPSSTLKLVSNGLPYMFFACIHTFPDKPAEVFLGANSENWTGLPTVGRLQRKIRDHKLENYIEKTRSAFEKLRELENEEEIRLQTTAPTLAPKARQLKARKAAIIRMRDQPEFLGRTTETGQAFLHTLQVRQCCYACKGMMGYMVPMIITKERDINTYLLTFDWVKRDGFVHACAETAIVKLGDR